MKWSLFSYVYIKALSGGMVIDFLIFMELVYLFKLVIFVYHRFFGFFSKSERN